MHRRGFLKALGLSAAAFALDPELALWVPGQKSYHFVSQPSGLWWSGWVRLPGPMPDTSLWSGHWVARESTARGTRALVNPVVVPMLLGTTPSVLDRARDAAERETRQWLDDKKREPWYQPRVTLT